MIISVGYRVNSHRGTQFRIWATQQLKEYLIKGFVMDDERRIAEKIQSLEALEKEMKQIKLDLKSKKKEK